MKKFLMLLAVAVLALGLSGTAMAVGNGVSIVGSAHDFTDGITVRGTGAETETTWNQTGELCRVCHVPHDHKQADDRYLSGLLWNRDATTETSYTMYDAAWSASFDTTGTQDAQPSGISKLCLGCHDGSTAIDRFDSYTGTDTMRTLQDSSLGALVIPEGAAGSLTMRGTHPISMVFDPAVDTKLNALATVMGSSGSIEDVLDLGNKVQCSSCHDVHNQESEPGTNFLRVGQTVAQGGTASGLCLTCHDK